jgi:ABC-type oligopeptide transport system substrate-binding subunit
MYAEAQEILVTDDVAMIPIYTAAQNVLRKPELQNLHFNPMGDARLGEVQWPDAREESQ